MTVSLAKRPTYDAEPEHDALCLWPYRDCTVVCGTATESTYSKFDSALAERLWTLSLDSIQDDELGDFEGFGWHALFVRDRAILVTGSQGFVTATTYQDESTTREAWAVLGRRYEDVRVRSVIDALDTSCEALFLIIDTKKHVHALPSMDELSEHIHAHRECFERNAWTLDV